MKSLKKILILYYGALVSQILYWTFLQNGCKNVFIFCMIAEGNGTHHLGQMAVIDNLIRKLRKGIKTSYYLFVSHKRECCIFPRKRGNTSILGGFLRFFVSFHITAPIEFSIFFIGAELSTYPLTLRENRM